MNTLGNSYLVKVGLMGHVGRFVPADGRSYSRNQRAVCRTSRGLEIGEILCELDPSAQEQCDGELLRRVTPDDRLVLDRIERFRDRAFTACSNLLKSNELDAVLIDVEHLFDGESLYFHFLGDVSEEVQQLTGQLAEVYEKKVRFRKFAETLANGCGPDCGTGAAKCATGSCASCGLAGNCKTATGMN